MCKCARENKRGGEDVHTHTTQTHTNTNTRTQHKHTHTTQHTHTNTNKHIHTHTTHLTNPHARLDLPDLGCFLILEAYSPSHSRSTTTTPRCPKKNSMAAKSALDSVKREA